MSSYNALSDEGRDRADSQQMKACTVAFDVSFRVPQRVDTSTESKFSLFRRKKKGAQLVDVDEIPLVDVLKEVKGVIKPGELLAVMGPSGSGKTSLLNCLSLRNPNFTGKVLYDGLEVDATVAAALSGFVQQQDMFMPTLTPLECLEFYASLSPRGGSHERIERLLDTLGLRKICHTLIGGEGSLIKGISGGERKRLSIGLEMLSDPPILFLDEPTSGLDAYMAEAVVFMLKDMAKKDKKVIVATIHQPSSDVFDAFSFLLLLGEGRMAYYGPTTKAVSYFSRLGYNCPQFHNPADFLIKLISDRVMSIGLENSKTGALTGNLQSIAEAWQMSPEADVLSAEIAGLAKDDSDTESGVIAESVLTSMPVKKRPTPWFQFKLLLFRNGVMTRRDPILTHVRMAQAVFTGMLGGTIYYQDADRPVHDDKVQSINGAIFFLLFTNAVGGTLGLLQAFPREAAVMIKEYGDGLYAIPPYFLARTLVELPMQILAPMVQFTIMYFLAGFAMDMNQYCEIFLGMLLTTMAAFSFGYIPGSAIAESAVAIAVSNFFTIPMVIFGGYMINVDDIPIFYEWLAYLSYIRYGYEGMMISFWRRIDTIECDDDDCAYSTGKDVLDDYSFSHHLSTYWRNMSLNCVLFVCARLVAMGMLQWRANKDVKRGAGFV